MMPAAFPSLAHGLVQPLPAPQGHDLALMPHDVLARVQAGDPSWTDLVPPPVVRVIRKRGLFGYLPPAAKP